MPDAAAGTPTAVTCSGKAKPDADTVWTIMSGGIPRVVNVHVPGGYDPARGTALVVNFHGFTSDAPQEAILSLMNDKAEDAGFIVMYPYGTGSPLSWNAGACCGTAAASEVDDIQFVRDILDRAQSELCIDPARVYATGMSNGGFLSHRIGCELADRFAAIAPVAGVLGIDRCTPSRPVPVIEFHGTDDTLVPWDGSESLGFPSVMDTFHGWAQRDGCTGEPAQTYAHGDATCQTYSQCAAGAEVTLCTIDGGGHTWPGGTPVPSLGVTSTDINATDAMWSFFAAHPK
jgi:polyhydroxybutyrate depolymerase